ncbi:hypothetical protein BDV40DRAFT_288471 [Aspergillus tamarii]|uniref:Uncharacterized protein n=1 Tax=Aspergillus tamarii TaxID=41984 RepID=A0A5N6UV06_ASPTM|nr:hypothetical protein BDV40DRAFT_288471 [Aspergillus tamarii]
MGEYRAAFKEDRQKTIETFRELKAADRLDEVEFQYAMMIEWFDNGWGLNAGGIYYRHLYSQGWVTPGHDLWIPSLDGLDWNHSNESSRRSRAKPFLSSEYAWEADVWKHVFSQMRDDPVLASSDKHEYNAINLKRDLVSCLLMVEPKFIKRTPDATSCLATFKPKDYRNPLSEWSLGHSRGCSSGAVYLGMLNDLARQPRKASSKNRKCQAEVGCSNNQVFISTSLGAHWHILYAGHDGFSESVYISQRIWSVCVVTPRKTWELLSNSIINRLNDWHEFHWAKHLSEEARGKLRERIISYFQQAYQRDLPDLTDNWPAVITCILDGCGPMGTPGYPIQSKEEMAAHYREVHGEDDGVIADAERLREEREETNNIDNPVQPTKKERAGGLRQLIDQCL